MTDQELLQAIEKIIDKKLDENQDGRRETRD